MPLPHQQLTIFGVGLIVLLLALTRGAIRRGMRIDHRTAGLGIVLGLALFFGLELIFSLFLQTA
ncbi:MAG: hypothetical protein ACK4WH_14220 [Phycisphaerales bacterium]